MVGHHEDVIVAFRESAHEIEIFMDAVASYIGRHPKLSSGVPSAVHSYQSRLKSEESFVSKLERKAEVGIVVDRANLFDRITDLGGVRVLHLYQDDFRHIDQVIRKRVSDGDWFLHEKPVAYTWDPENVEFFSQFDLRVENKVSSYTSVHYVVKPRNGSHIACEIQVRTLFEEIWGEIDHALNYPQPCAEPILIEQIRVLSKIVGAGSRLLDSLKRSQDVGKD